MQGRPGSSFPEEVLLDHFEIVHHPWIGVQAFFVYFVLGIAGIGGWFFLRLGSHRLLRWLVDRRLVNPVRGLARLRKQLPGWEVTEHGIQGRLADQDVLLSEQRVEVMLAESGPSPFTLTAIEKEPFLAGMPLLTGDPDFDKHYSLVSDDPLILAYFDVPTRQRLLHLRNVSGDQSGLRLSPGADLGGWVSDFMRGRQLGRDPSLDAEVRQLGGTLSWYLVEMLSLGRWFNQPLDLGTRLRQTLLQETAPALRDHLAALWCEAADAGRLQDPTWPEPTGRHAEDPLFRFLFDRAAGKRTATTYALFLPHCGAHLETVFLMDIAVWDENERLALIAHGITEERGFNLALEAARQLRGARVRAFLLQQAERLHDNILPRNRRRLPNMLRVLADLGTDEGTLALVWRCLRREQHVRLCLQILSEIGTVATVAKLAEYRNLIAFENSGHLETAIFELQRRHRLLSDGGSLSLAQSDDGCLSPASTQDGDLSSATRV